MDIFNLGNHELAGQSLFVVLGKVLLLHVGNNLVDYFEKSQNGTGVEYGTDLVHAERLDSEVVRMKHDLVADGLEGGYGLLVDEDFILERSKNVVARIDVGLIFWGLSGGGFYLSVSVGG